jgi:hypothetical protein
VRVLVVVALLLLLELLEFRWALDSISSAA